MSQKRKRNSYDVSFKLKVVDFAEGSSNCAAEREFGVTEKTVRDWRMKEEKLRNASSKTLKKMRPMLAPYEDMESKLKEWILDLRGNGYVVTRPSIRVRALQIAKELGHAAFKASNGWCTRFTNRHGLCLRQRTHIAQKLPSDVEDKVMNFHKFVIDLRKGQQFHRRAIGNMDETPMFFDMPGNRTVDVKGASTVSIKTSGAEKQHFTVILSCLADGTKLKPAVVFKRKTMPKEKLPKDIVVFVQEKGRVDERVLFGWLREVWFKRPGALLNGKSMLVWDMFRAHLLKSELKRNRTYQRVIPGGCTSVLQPLDVCLNKPFKVHMRQKWNEWMANGEKQLTKVGNLKRAELATVCQWIVDSWNEVPSDMVIRSFLKCGISNSIDGTEDELFSELIGGRDDVEQEKNTEECDLYDDRLSEEQFYELLGDSDKEYFEGF